MRRTLIIGGLIAAAIVAEIAVTRAPVRAADGDKPQQQTQAPPTSGGPAPQRPQGMGGPPPGFGSMPVDSFDAVRDSFIDVVKKQIAGRENVAAESVFKDIQSFKGRPAGQVLRAMDGFGHSLGVNCTYCHDANDWAKSSHVEKNTARDMMKMTGAINEEYLAKMPDIKSEHPHVGCMTCHRGVARPGARPAGAPRPGGG